MKVTLRVKRFEAGRNREPYWAEYEVEAEPTDRVLDLLHAVKWH